MKTKILIAIVCFVLCFASFANAAIYIAGQLYSGNTLNIVNSSYNNQSISVTGNSIVNFYGNQDDGEHDFANISLSGNSVANVFYVDEFYNWGGGVAGRPGIGFNINAKDDSVINFISEDYDFAVERWDGENDIPVELGVYSGLQINTTNYPLFAAYSMIWRSWSNLAKLYPDVSWILAPTVGDFSLQNNAVINFVPEPATLMLISAAVPLILRKKRQN